MSKPGAECARCHRKVITDAAVICRGCGAAFTQAVADLQALLPELAVTVSKQDDMSQPATHANGKRLDGYLDPRPLAERIAAYRADRDTRALVSHPMPVNLDAAALFAEVRAMLIDLVRPLTAPPWAFPADLPAAVAGPVHAWCMHPSCRAVIAAGRPADRVCAWLIANVDQVRRHPRANRIVRDVETARRHVEIAIDRRDPELYVGPCDSPDFDVRVTLDGDVIQIGQPTSRICGADLYARLEDHEVECPACGWRYLISERRSWLLDAVRDVWARPAMIASALTSMQLELTAPRLDQWISRDKRKHRRCLAGEDGCGCILQVGIDSDEVNDKGEPAGKPLYRIGDVLDRLESMRMAEAARALAAGAVAAS